MNIVIDAPPDPARWRAGFRHVLSKPVRRLRIRGSILVLLGLLVLVISGGEFDGLVFGCVIVAIGLIYAVLAPARSVAISLKRMPMALTQPQRFELTERSVRISSPLMTAEYAWAAFQRAELTPGYLMLMTGQYQVIPVPLDGLTPPELAELGEYTANLNYARQ